VLTATALVAFVGEPHRGGARSQGRSRWT
jgi:hypothetical protein